MSKTAADHIRELLSETSLEEITKQLVEKIKEHYGIGEANEKEDKTADR